MRLAVAAFFVLFAFATPALASPALAAARPHLAPPPALQAARSRLSRVIQPSVAAWVKAEAAKLAAAPVDLRGDIGARFPGLSNPKAIAALEGLVASQAVDDIDSQSELGETESLRLQMAMDRLSKLMDTLSNVLKALDDTSSSIVQNLK